MIGHHNDINHWALDMDESGPLEVEASNFKYPRNTKVYDAAYDYTIKCKYKGGINTTISSKFEERGTKWIGTDGWVFVSRRKLEASNMEWVKKDFNPGWIKAYNSPSHHQNFIDSVKSRKPCICPMARFQPT